MKTTIINAQIKPELKNEVEEILSQLGLTTTQAITIFFEQIKLKQGIPFELNIPNDETVASMKEAKANCDLQTTSIEQLRTQMTK